MTTKRKKTAAKKSYRSGKNNSCGDRNKETV
jgi:hypothetical protein